MSLDSKYWHWMRKLDFIIGGLISKNENRIWTMCFWKFALQFCICTYLHTQTVSLALMYRCKREKHKDIYVCVFIN